MPDAPSLSDRIAARLERLAEMDLAAAEHVHAQLIESTEPTTTAELARAYQRASRTLRQTLMLQMKHERDTAEAAARAARLAPPSYDVPETALDRLVNGRIEDLQDAVARVAAAAYPHHPRFRREVLDRLDVELDDWSYEDDFIDGRLHDKVVEACRRLDLPMTVARKWADLPPPPDTFDPAETEPPTADTG